MPPRNNRLRADPAGVAALAADLARLLELVEDLHRRLCRPPGGARHCPNADRDRFFADLRGQGRTWPEIHARLLTVAPARGWAVVADGRGCAAAYYRLLARERRSARAQQGATPGPRCTA
jgi:hypothetical protein